MGLDMYLSKKHFIDSEERATLTIGGIDQQIDVGKVECIVEDAGCWRKANAIHQWFVTQVQHGVDNCAPYEVSRAQLVSLLELVEQSLADASNAADLLPTSAGFFFGSTAYDEDYRFDLEQTRDILTAALRDDDPSISFAY